MSCATSWDNKRPLSTAEMLALLEEDEDLQPAESIDVVYIPPPVDELTDEEDIDDDIMRESDDFLLDVAGTYEIHANLPDETEVKEPPTPSSSKKMKTSTKPASKVKKVIPKWKKENPIYTSLPQEEEKVMIKLRTNLVENHLTKFFRCI